MATKLVAHPIKSTTFMLVGDVMLGTSFPDGYLPPMETNVVGDSIRLILTKDNTINIGNLEGAICNEGMSQKCTEIQNCYVFKMPEYFADSLAQLDFNMMSLANNHSNDFGDSCLTNTENILNKTGIQWSGRSGTIGVLEDSSVALIAFYYGKNANDLLNPRQIKELIGVANQLAEIVVVTFHGGAEGATLTHTPDSTEYYLGEKRGNTRFFAHYAIDAGADIVFGHGPHVLRGFELYKKKLIAYSLGNFATYGRFLLKDNYAISAILEVTIDSNGNFLHGKIHSVLQEGWGIPFYDDKKHAVKLIQQMTIEDFAGGHLIIERDGSVTPQHAPLFSE